MAYSSNSRRNSSGWFLRLKSLSVATASALWAAACASTGGPFGITEEQGKALGDQEHPKILAAFGGELNDPQLEAYVGRIHDRLIAASPTPNADIELTILDSPVINAMALPGHVYVTRGLLALANSEAEVAGVIGHEVGHVFERHTAQRVSRSNLSGLGAAAIAILTGDEDTGQLAGQAAQLYLLRFSRTQEYEADLVGVRLLADAGYEPTAQADFLTTLGRWSALESRITGDTAPPEFLSTHPNSAERVRRAADEARVVGQGGVTTQTSRASYLKAIDGLVYGDDPVKQGFIRGREFIHPAMGIAFTVPESFQLRNTSQSVYAQSQSGAALQFTSAASDQSPTALIDGPISQSLGVDLSPARAISVNRRSAAVGEARANTQSGPVDVAAFAIRWAGNTNYVFLWVTPVNQTRQLQSSIERTVESLRSIDARNVDTPPTLHVDVAVVQSRDTAASLARLTEFSSNREDRFVIMNGLDGNQRLQTGEHVKLVR